MKYHAILFLIFLNSVFTLKKVLYFSFMDLIIIAVILAIYIRILLSQKNNVKHKDWLHAAYNNKNNRNKTYSLEFIFDWYKDPYFVFVLRYF